MKQFTRLFFIAIIFLHLSYARAAERAPSPYSLIPIEMIWPGSTSFADPLPYQMRISARAVDQSRQMNQFIASQTILGILEADLAPWTSLQGFAARSGEACTISITVTVRIGFDSNFVEASGSVDGIPCDDVVNAIRRLRDQLLAGIQ